MKIIKKYDIAVFVLSFLLVVIFFGLYQKVQQNDAYIYYKYAFNIFNGNGYVFNIGEKANAATSTLYTIMLALLFSLFKWIPFLSLPIIGHIIGAISIWIISIASLRMYKNSNFLFVPFVLPFIFISNPLLKNSVGMETFLTLAMISLCLLFYQQKKIFLTSLFLGLSILARPDSIILAIILTLDFIKNARKFPSIRYFIGFLLVVLPWVLFSFIYFGSPCLRLCSLKLHRLKVAVGEKA